MIMMHDETRVMNEDEEPDHVCWKCSQKDRLSKMHDPPYPKKDPEERYCEQCIKIVLYELLLNQFRCPDCNTALGNIGWGSLTAYCPHCHAKWEIAFGKKIPLGGSLSTQ